MMNFWHKNSEGRKVAIIFIVTAFLLNSFIVSIPCVLAQVMTGNAMVQPETAVLAGMKVYADSPLHFDFIVDSGNGKGPAQGPARTLNGMGVGADPRVRPLQGTQAISSVDATHGADRMPHQDDINRLIKYFLASLTIPEKELWVNLSPYEKDRIVTDAFGQTEMGRDLLAQDYLLKQMTAKLMHPDDAVGQEFWKKIYAKAFELYGTTDIPVDTFNKVWIMPQKAVVYENISAKSRQAVAVVAESRLKVMLENDYLSMSNNGLPTRGHSAPQQDNQRGSVSPSTLPTERASDMKATQVTDRSPNVTTQEWAKNIIREIIIPVLENEVNEGAAFTKLRQVYHSLILAAWYKHKMTQSLLNQVYVDKEKVQGVNIPDPQETKRIWAQYVDTFKQGVVNLVREERDPALDEPIPRKYFSGGVDLAQNWGTLEITTTDQASLPSGLSGSDRAGIVSVDLFDYSMTVKKQEYASFIDKADVADMLPEHHGAKGASLMQIVSDPQNKLRVPPFVIVRTSFMRQYKPEEMDFNVLAAAIEEQMGQKINSKFRVSVRGAGIHVMPGMLETKLNVSNRKALVSALKDVYASWDSQKSKGYRQAFGISDEEGMAIIVQQMVDGDRNQNSASGAFYTRDPETGVDGIVGRYRVQATGDETMTGSRKSGSRKVEQNLKDDFPQAWRELNDAKTFLEKKFGYPQEVEFVIQDGVLYILQSRDADMGRGMAPVAMEKMYQDGVISSVQYTNFLKQYTAEAEQKMRAIFSVDENANVELIAEHEGLSFGAMDGSLAFSVEAAKRMRQEGKRVILLSIAENDGKMRQELFDGGLDGLITLYGDYSAHDARILRELGVPGVAMLEGYELNEGQKTITIAGRSFAEGSRIIIDSGKTGKILTSSDNELLRPMGAVLPPASHEKVTVIEKKIKDRFQALPYASLQALHLMLRANMVRLRLEGNRDNLLDLEVALTSLHQEIIVPKGLDLKKTKDQMKYELYGQTDESILKYLPKELNINSLDDFLGQADQILNMTVNRYAGWKFDHLDYSNFDLFKINNIDSGKNMPVEFSIIMSNASADLRNENMDLMSAVWQPRFYAHVDASWGKEPWKDIELVDVRMQVDPMDPAKIRVQGRIPFKEHARSMNMTFKAVMDNPDYSLNADAWLDLKGKRQVMVRWGLIKDVQGLLAEHLSKADYLVSNEAAFLLSLSDINNQVRQRISEEKEELDAGSGYRDVQWQLTRRYDLEGFPLLFKHLYLGSNVGGLSSVTALDEFQDVVVEMIKELLPAEGVHVSGGVWRNTMVLGHADGETLEYKTTWINITDKTLAALIDMLAKVQAEVDVGKILNGPTKESVLVRLVTALYEHKIKNDKNVGKKASKKTSDQAAAALNPGGIDLNYENLNLEVKSAGNVLNFNIDPVLLEKYKGASGFVPVISDIQPLENLPKFIDMKTL